MDQLDWEPNNLAAVFNAVNPHKGWTARPVTKNAQGVLFVNNNHLANLFFDCEDMRFNIRFTRFHATWGDYQASIGRALYTVLNVLRLGGYPVNAPASYDGIDVITSLRKNGEAYVSIADMIYDIPSQDQYAMPMLGSGFVSPADGAPLPETADNSAAIMEPPEETADDENNSSEPVDTDE